MDTPQKKTRKPKAPIDYQKSIIYMLEPTCEYEDGDVYYGSTASTLVKRLWGHKKPSNTCKSKILIDKYGRDNIKIVFIKNFPCSSIDELNAEEGKYHRANKCVNKYIAGRKSAEYYQDNKEQICEYQKQYYHDNAEQRCEYQKQYNKDNAEQICEKKKQYYQDNREQRCEYHKKYYQKKKLPLNAIAD